MSTLETVAATPELVDNRRYELRIATMVIIICMMGPFGMDGFVPSLPAMTRALHSSANIMQLTIAFYLFGAVFSQLIYGPLSDRFGRRKLILAGMSLAMVGSLLGVLAGSPFWVIFARFIQGAGIGSVNALHRAIMRDTFSGTRMAKIASYIGMVYTVIIALAPVIGGYIQVTFNWRGNFIFLTLLVMINLLLVWLFLPETNHHLSREATRFKTVAHNYATLLKSPIFVGYTLCSSIALAGLVAYFTASPFLLQNLLGLSPVQYGWSCILLALGLILGSYINSALIMKRGAIFMLILGVILMVFAGMLMLSISLMGFMTPSVIIVPAMLFDVAGGFVYANAMTGAFQPFANMAGSAGALYGSLQILTAALTSLVVASLHEQNQNTLALIFIFLGASAGWILFRMIRPAEKFVSVSNINA